MANHFVLRVGVNDQGKPVVEEIIPGTLKRKDECICLLLDAVKVVIEHNTSEASPILVPPEGMRL